MKHAAMRKPGVQYLLIKKIQILTSEQIQKRSFIKEVVKLETIEA